MSKTVHHRDGSKTVWFANGKKATFGAPRPKQTRQITGTPYVFASGRKIELPPGIAHGMIFEVHGRTYVGMRYHGTDKLGRKVCTSYGQPITLTRSL